MNISIRNGDIVTPFEILKNFTIEIENGIIKKIFQNEGAITPNSDIIDAAGMYICPGLIDIHFHGAIGKDTMDAIEDNNVLKLLAQFCVEHGVTSFYPTTWSQSKERIYNIIEVIKSLEGDNKGAQILGVHLEGPYLNQKNKGAQSSVFIRDPEKSEYSRWLNSGVVKLITCAPEIQGCSDFIHAAIENGIRISVGHTNASFEETIHAIDLGATQATHLFNGMPSIHHREPGVVTALLNDERVFTQIICDGIHLHPSIISLVIKLKSPSRTILITDSTMATGIPDGKYINNGQIMIIKNGIVRTLEGGLSGSTVTMDQSIRNLLKFTNLELTDVIQAATSTPAQEMGLLGSKGIIQEGADADFVMLSKDLVVQKTFVKGKCLFSKN
ncbi:MAG: N-acetylglucosamine-6-phosphate deacetylase [Clostridiaceae bacterium]|nr:N-acetylglucosamine-6-phosphate deacetylase [Clostridiaceae bacterium]